MGTTRTPRSENGDCGHVWSPLKAGAGFPPNPPILTIFFTPGACQLRPISNVYLVNGGSAAAERWALIYSEGEGSTTRDPATGTRLFPQGGGGPFADPKCRRDLKNRYVDVKE